MERRAGRFAPSCCCSAAAARRCTAAGQPAAELEAMPAGACARRWIDPIDLFETAIAGALDTPPPASWSLRRA